MLYSVGSLGGSSRSIRAFEVLHPRVLLTLLLVSKLVSQESGYSRTGDGEPDATSMDIFDDFNLHHLSSDLTRTTMDTNIFDDNGGRMKPIP